MDDGDNMNDSSIVRLIALIIAVSPALIMFAYFVVTARVSLRVEKLWSAFAFGAAVTIPCALLGAPL